MLTGITDCVFDLMHIAVSVVDIESLAVKGHQNFSRLQAPAQVVTAPWHKCLQQHG